MEIVADGEATIENDDLTFARQIALRRAMVSAAEQGGGLLQSTTVSTPAGIQERSSLSSRNRVLGARILNEAVEKDKLRLTAEVRLDDPGSVHACDGLPHRKVAVTAFPLVYPEQLHTGSFTGWGPATAEELADQLNRGGRLLAASAADRMAFDLPEKAPEPARKAGVPLLTAWAGESRAQYVVAGVFRDLGKASRALVVPEQQMAVEAFIYDGFSGELLARRDFSRQLLALGSLPSATSFGGKDFRESRFGKTYLGLVRDLAAWAENTIGCMPFAARVVKVDGRRLYLDVGSDSGLEPGMEFLLTREKGSAIAIPGGEVLGHDRQALAGVVVKNVQARYSVAEITARKNAPAARVGDVIFGQ